jgi:hypothetical protein
MSEEIAAGLKNAIERGVSIENAIQSFINSGYNPVEVKAAAQSLQEGAFPIVYPQNNGDSIQVPKSPQQYPKLSKPSDNTKIQEPSKTASKFLVAGVIILLVAVLVGVFFIFLKEPLTTLIFGQ